MIDLSFWKLAAQKWTSEKTITIVPDAIKVAPENQGEDMLSLLINGGEDLLEMLNND